jgi:hypothetical protein
MNEADYGEGFRQLEKGERFRRGDECLARFVDGTHRWSPIPKMWIELMFLYDGGVTFGKVRRKVEKSQAA